MPEQKRVLSEIINSNQNTKFGRKHNFSKIKSINDFQEFIPVTKYEDYASYINDIMNGTKNILTSEEVLLLEPTGGSTDGSKYIPYTFAEYSMYLLIRGTAIIYFIFGGIS